MGITIKLIQCHKILYKAKQWRVYDEIDNTQLQVEIIKVFESGLYLTATISIPWERLNKPHNPKKVISQKIVFSENMQFSINRIHHQYLSSPLKVGL